MYILLPQYMDWPEIGCLMEVSTMFYILQMLCFYLVQQKCPKIIFWFFDVENAEILHCKIMYHFSHLLIILQMKNQYFSGKFICFSIDLWYVYSAVPKEVLWQLTTSKGGRSLPLTLKHVRYLWFIYIKKGGYAFHKHMQ